MKRLIFLFVLLFVCAACQSGHADTAVIDPASIETPTPLPPTAVPDEHAALVEAFQTIVDAQAQAGQPGVILRVEAPDIDLAWEGAAGVIDKESGRPITTSTPFRLASISKMMTATAVLHLVEEGKVDLDAPISTYLDASITDLLNGRDGETYGDEITVRQLLSHTSGINGYFDEDDRNGNRKNDFIDNFMTDKDRIWEPATAVVHVTSEMKPLFAPGEKWAYSDTNYILAGMIVEEVSGMALSEAYDAWIFEPLGMDDTYLATLGDPRLQDAAHVYFDVVDVSGYKSLSWQWGCAGVVSTAEDLSRFMWAWVNDELFADAATKEKMRTWTSMASAGYDGLYYGLGIVDIDFASMGLTDIDEIMGHNGMWNSFVYYWPSQNIVMAGTLNQGYPNDAYTEPVFQVMQAVLAGGIAE